MIINLRDRLSVPRLWLVTFALWLAIAALTVGALWHQRREALDGQTREIGLLSLALSDEIDRSLHGVEEGLSALRLELRGEHLPLTGTEAENALYRRVRLMPTVRILWLIDRGGHLLSASAPLRPPDLSSFLPPLDQLADDGTALSQHLGMGDTRSALVVLAAHFSTTPGQGDGWVLAGIPDTTLLGAFTAASPGADARMAVFRNDGERLAGSLVDAPAVGETKFGEHQGSLTNIAFRRFSDGGERLVSQQSLPRYGLKIVLTRDMGAVLKVWRETAELAVAGLMLLLVILAALARQVRRADKLHAEARRALQTQRSRSRKLEALGTLAGGVAHDFNNVLAAIFGFAEMAQDAAPPGSDQARHLDKLLQAALRGKSLAERILAFSRGGGHAMIVFELEPIVDEVLSLLAASLRPGVILESRLEAVAARLRGDPTQTFEAIMNLCTNAMQAMSEGGGTLSVQLKRLHVAGRLALSHGQLTEGDYLSLSVSDQGAGIKHEVMEHLFEPFFTTRGAQSGTGLGLAVVHGVVTEFGGAIDVQSTAGLGSRFTLYFPECFDPIGATEPLSNELPMGVGQRVMVVDDDPALVALADEVLKGLGYDPVGYHDPIAALAALKDDPERFSAVITDEVMPRLSGTQLTAALRPIAPDLPVLLVSGYGGAFLASRAVAVGVTRVLSKPLQRAELARVLAELLYCRRRPEPVIKSASSQR
ncbi:MAG: sensor hybrid histidine kinase [Proteobacteria bacterium]|nr:sensor hybrid histidine kinase [Pseudomonadota bacterium]